MKNMDQQWAAKLSSRTFNLVKEMVLWVQPDGKIFLANDAFIKKVGYSKAALANMFVWDFSAEFPSLKWEEHWQVVKNQRFKRLVSIWFSKSGEPLAVDLSLHYVEIEGKAYINAIAHNIGKKMEREHLIEMTYQTLNNSSDLVIWSNSAGKIIYFNEVANQLLGYEKSEFQELSGQDLVYQFDQHRRSESVAEMNKNQALQSEVPLKKKNGQIIITELTASLFEHQGEMITCSIFRDITAKRAREDRLRQLLLENQAMKQELEGEVNYLQAAIQEALDFQEIVTVSPSYEKILRLIKNVAPTTTTVLLLGETGTGKELLARAIHRKSNRANKPLIKINCGALPTNLIEGELFGYEKGAFTGAQQAKKGRFELAHQGTIFLDEIGEMPLNLQVKLLRVLQEGEFTKLGATRPTKVDVRIISATNRDLQAMIKAKTFRQDLYYRLSVFPINSIPLRERKEDIPELAYHFMQKFSSKQGKKVNKIPLRSMKKLLGYDYPGNIRELENIIERATILTKNRSLSLQHWLPKKTTKKKSTLEIKSFDDFQRDYLIQILKYTNGKVSGTNGAASLLKMNGKTLDSKMRKFGIQRSDFT